MANKPALRTNNKYNHIISITVKEATLWSNCTEEMNTCLSLHKFTQLYKIKNYTVLFYSFNSPSVKKVTLLYQGLLRGLFTRPCEDVKCSEPTVFSCFLKSKLTAQMTVIDSSTRQKERGVVIWTQTAQLQMAPKLDV